MPLAGQRVLVAIAQAPFDRTNPETYVESTFCTLAPLMVEGERASPSDFPNRGLVWWRLSNWGRLAADPGRLMKGALERAPGYNPDAPTKDHYQIDANTITSLGSSDFYEIVAVDEERVATPDDLVSAAAVAVSDHLVSTMVLARWQDNVYGPFRVHQIHGDRGKYSLQLAATRSDSSILTIPWRDVAALDPRSMVELTAEVSFNAHSRDKSYETGRCNYTLLARDAFEGLCERDYQTSTVVPDEELVRKLAKQFLSRKQRQQLNTLLTDLDEVVAESTEGLNTSAVQRISKCLDGNLELTNLLASSLLDSGLLDEQIQACLAERAERYVEENANKLEVGISERVAELQKQLADIEHEKLAASEELETRQRQMERQLAALRGEHEKKLKVDRVELEKLRRQLEEQQKLLAERLEDVVERYKDHAGDVVRDFLVLYPLVAGALPSARAATIAESAEPEEIEANLDMPMYVRRRGDPVDAPEVTEDTFFQRFQRLVRARGYQYRRLDLVSFHISVKCGLMTVLGGLSGTGKSTLPRLYAEALAGSDERRYLQVGVRPSWLDMEDLLGHCNTLDREFQPSTSGLFHHLIWAQEEYHNRGPGTGIHLVNLDEMNLSQVEHYFSGFLQVMELPEGQREIRVFDSRGIRANSIYCQWAALKLPPSLRFVGTVNFDETTKPLSIRFLDRANMLRLWPAPKLADVPMPATDEPDKRAEGPPVCLRDFRKWVKMKALDSQAAEVLDGLKGPLSKLGCPLNQRQSRGICRFLASAAGLATPSQALDLQIAQRIVPQVRDVYSHKARDALDEVIKTLEKHGDAFSESLARLRLRREDMTLAQA